MRTKKDFDFKYEQFKLVINQINFTDIKTLSESLKINIKQCHRYIIRLRTEIANRIKDKSNHDDFEEIEYSKGSYRSFNHSLNRIVKFSESETKMLMNQLFHSDFVERSTKLKLLTLITNNVYKPKVYNDNISVIEMCIENKLPMTVENAYTYNQHLFEKEILYPIYVDIEKSILYALYNESIKRFNIYALSGCAVYVYKKNEKKEMWHYRDLDLFVTYTEDIDVFGYSKDSSGKGIKVILNLKDYAKAIFLKESILFQKYIKEQKNDIYPYKLKLVLYDIDTIANIIIANSNHIQIVGDNDFKKKLKVYKDEMVEQLKNIIPD